MISVIINWFYILVTAGIIGSAALYPFYKICGYRFRRADSFLMAGLIAVTVYAQFFSLFYKVGAAANFILIAACILINCLWGKKLLSMAGECLKKPGRGRAVCFAVLLVLFLYATSAGYMMYDSNLYHAQSIRWIEEYGVVKGLGNLHSRLAYNSASFALSALYSMSYVMGQSLHCAAGLLAFLVLKDSLKFLEMFRRKKLLLSDCARIGAFYYVTIIFREIVSPASDYFMILTVFYLVIRWLELLERKEENAVPYALLCVAAVYAVTLKVSAGIILLLVLKPAYMLLRGRKWKQTGVFLAMGLLTAAPFFIRNVVISGFLVYPYTAIDLFAVDWRMPVFKAQYDMTEIQAWAKGIKYVEFADLPVKQWWPYWFKHELKGMEKIWILADLAALAAELFYFVWAAVKQKREEGGKILLLLTVTACYLFWQFSAPMMRYGYVYPVLLAMLVWGSAAQKLIQQYKRLLLPICLAFSLLPLYRSARMLQDTAFILREYGVHAQQQDYDDYDAAPVSIGSFSVYEPVNGDQLGYLHFPSTPDASDVISRGDTAGDGFLYHYK